MPRKRNYSRLYKAQMDDRERRLVILARYRAERRKLCDYAKEMGITVRTAQKDQKEYVRRLVQMSHDQIDFERQRVFHELGELKAELQVLRASLAASVGMPIKDRLQIALQIIDRDVVVMKREAELLGLDAPSKSITAHIDTTGDGRFHRFIEAAAGLCDAQLETVLTFAASMQRKPLELPAGPPPPPLELEGQ